MNGMMPRTRRLLVGVLAFIVVTSITLGKFPSASSGQSTPALQTGLSQAIVAINNAQAAGATPNAIAPLVIQLNNALELNREALNLPNNQTQQRDALLSNVSQILTNVTNQANDLTTTADQRTFAEKFVTYVTGLILALVGTFAYAFGLEFYERYRIKRTFQMRIRRR